MSREEISALVDKLEGAVLEAESSGIPMNEDYESCTEGYKHQRAIHSISRALNFTIVKELDQEIFDRLVLAMKKSTELLKGSTYGEYQKVRLITLIRTGLMQEEPRLAVLECAREYIPEAMIGIRHFL